jgi:hypothetical protein
MLNLPKYYLPHLPLEHLPVAHFLATFLALSHLPLAAHFLAPEHLPLAEHFAPMLALSDVVHPVKATRASPSIEAKINFFIFVS